MSCNLLNEIIACYNASLKLKFLILQDVSSFFTYHDHWGDSTPDEWGLLTNEIDIEMTGNQDASIQFTTHHPGDPNSWSYGEIIDVDFNPHIEFHDYAIEWTPYSIKCMLYV